MFRRIIFLLLFFAGLHATHAQVQTRIVGDSVLMHGNSGTTELNLENSTRGVNGFLYNKGNGRTEFRRGLIQLTDSTYQIGADTLLLNYQVNRRNVYYVSKKFSGSAGAVFTGMTVASISSSNQGYSTQLAKARPGSLVFSYPDPFSARNAAMDDINAGKIKAATIIVLSGNSYTIGSDNPAQNGDTSYNANSNYVADIGFSLANRTATASLMQNNIHYFFEQDAELHYVNSAFQLFMSYQVDTTHSPWKSGVFGHGFFKQYYGQKQGFSSGWCFISNANANLTFTADYLELQYWQGFWLENISNFHIDIRRILAGYVNILIAQYLKDGSSKAVNGYFNCDDLIYGQDRIRNSHNDYWSAFIIGRKGTFPDTSTTKKNISINVGNADIRVGCAEYDGFFATYGITNANISVNFDNLRQTSASIAWSSTFASLFGTSFAQLSDVLMNVNINTAITEYPLFGMVKNSYASASRFSRFNFHCGLHRKVQSPTVPDDWAKRNINIQNDYVSSTVTAKMTISGTYINDCNSEVVAMDYTAMSKLVELKGYFKTSGAGKHVMILNGYQDKRFAITDATLINDGTVPTIALKGSQNAYGTLGGIPLNTARTIYIKNVHATSSADVNVTTVGDSIRVVPDLADYY